MTDRDKKPGRKSRHGSMTASMEGVVEDGNCRIFQISVESLNNIADGLNVYWERHNFGHCELSK